jgi:hypothetical protein
MVVQYQTSNLIQVIEIIFWGLKKYRRNEWINATGNSATGRRRVLRRPLVAESPGAAKWEAKLILQMKNIDFMLSTSSKLLI